MKKRIGPHRSPSVPGSVPDDRSPVPPPFREGTDPNALGDDDRSPKARRGRPPRKDAPSGVARARAEAGTPDVVAQRVEEIIGLMRSGDYVTGETCVLLAEKWNLSVSTVQNYTAEASRAIARLVTDPVAVKEHVATTLDRVMSKAERAGEFGDVARLGDVFTRIVGAREPEKKQLDVNVQQYAQLPPHKKIEVLDAQIAKLQAARAALLKQGSITVPALPRGKAEDDDE